MNGFGLYPVGRVHSAYGKTVSPELLLSSCSTIEIDEEWSDAAEDIRVGDRLLVLFRFHLSSSIPLKVHPRGDPDRPLTGVFSTCSPRRPNFIGVGDCRVTSRDGLRIQVAGLDALDGSPVLDMKPFRIREDNALS
jgi:tRNA-Thr(GGU) m(6)t(6)A37 methyltransferase TsaA